MIINDLRDKLPKNQDPNRVWSKRDLKDIDTVTIHQAASKGNTLAVARYHTTPTKDRDGDGIIEVWERNHVSSKGAPAICYHYTIEPDGQINWCNDLDDIVWHVGTTKGNKRAIGICVLGNFSGPSWEAEEPSDAQIVALLSLLDYILTKSDTSISRKRIMGHSELKKNKENCPGTTLMNLVKTYRA
jgi:N-acetyl-anhydromuramyl-L-alanine amidase AmpD